MEYRAINNEDIILKKASQGDTAAFTKLFYGYWNKLYQFIFNITHSKELAEDVVQDVFTKIWMNREDLVNVKQFNAYLFRIAQNHAINNIKRLDFLQVHHKKIEAVVLHSTPQADSNLLNKETIQNITTAIAKLPPQQKLVYTLCREHGLKQQEVAEKLNLSVSTIKNHMLLAVTNLKAQLKKNYYNKVTILLLLIIRHLLKF